MHTALRLFIILPAILSILIIQGGFPVRAEVFYFKDSSGRVHISDSPVHQGFEQILPTRKEQLQPVVHPPVGNVEPETSLPEIYMVDDTSFGVLIHRHATRYQLNPNLVRAVIKVESDFDPQVVSRAGARGLMQLMPGTAKDLGVKNSFDPDQNIAGGCRYLRQMLDRFSQNLDLALAAYNAGPGRVEKAGRRIPDIRETRNYVRKVNHYMARFSSQHPGHVTASRMRRAAIDAWKRGRNARALTLFRQAAALDPTDATNPYNIGWLYAQDGYYQKAMQMYRLAIKLDPFMKAAYYNLAVTCERRGEIRESIHVWNDYISCESDTDKVATALSYIRELEKYLEGK